MDLTALPPWALGAVLDLVGLIARLVSASTDEERVEAMYQASEALKARLDQQRFGGG